ncbi:MAG: family 43 glycosylhydrolase [Chitinophaga sp.]|uniref:family 43 glycosylhydrolase n=1 Tax=Chitinophaga sp. TaxID=1869181 RepID=UPI003459A0D5|nr:family 43 glycosylhydrolase [Chitinophaga sp.]
MRKNFIILSAGDWPDPNIIRVGDDFYFISTSMHYVPGSPIARSKDLPLKIVHG